MLLLAFVTCLFLTHLKIASGLSGSACCSHPTAPHLTRKVQEHMNNVGQYECSARAGASRNLSHTGIVELTLANITAPDLFTCLYPFLVEHNVSVDTLVGLNVEGSFTQRKTISGAPQPKVEGPILKSPVSVVKFTHLGFTQLYPVLLEAFSAINELILNSNNMTELTGLTFQSESLLYLEVLDLSNNQIATVDACTFQNVNNLIKLSLSGNFISTITTGTFSQLPLLEDLDLSRNRFIALHSRMFDGLSTLISLNMSENQIQTLDLNYPYDCTAGANSCQSNCTSPTRLNSLETLDLTFNEITEISDPFQRMCFIRTLDLSRNRIKSVQLTTSPPQCADGVLDNYSALVLNFSHNELQELLPGIFIAMPGIATLDLSHNLLSNVHDDAFNGSQLLRDLLLHHNDLQQLVTNNLHRLNILDLRQNQFSRVSLSWVESLAAKDGNIKLGGNRLQCDETMAQLFQLVTCNEIPEDQQYSSQALAQLEALDGILSATSNAAILPAPGLCTRRVSECSKFGANMNLCLLQSYMEWLKNGTLPDNKNVLVRMLTQIESLYHYARNAASQNESANLGSVKEYVVDVLGEISSQVELRDDWLLGYMSSDIVMGAYDVSPNLVSDATGNLTESERSIAFTVLNDGKATFIDDKKQFANGSFAPNGQTAGVDTTVKACGANVTSKMPIDIKLPASILTGGEKQRLTFAMYKNDFLFPPKKRQQVLSGIISAEVKGKNVKNATKPILISATFNGTSLPKENITCAFWVPASKSWSTKGCVLVNYTETGDGQGLMKATCECTHLTNFGILLDFAPDGASSQTTKIVINTISEIGIIASIVGLVITIVYRLLVRELRRGVPQLILLNLCFCLLIVYVFLLFAENSSLLQNSEACFAVAMILHFFLLSVWGWNMVEAVSMYLLLVRVYNVSMRRFLRKAAVACYGGSLILLLAALCVSSAIAPGMSITASYTAKTVCFAAPPTSHFLVILPITIAFLANLVLFVLIIRGLNSSSKAVAARKESRKLKNRLRQAVCVTALLGITWLFGFLKVVVQMAAGPNGYTASQGEAVFAFDILFTVFNSIQGFVIFLMFCFLRIIQESRCLKKWERMRTDSTISSPRWVSGSETGRKSTSTF